MMFTFVFSQSCGATAACACSSLSWVSYNYSGLWIMLTLVSLQPLWATTPTCKWCLPWSSANLMLDGTTVACGQCSPVFSQSCATTVACGQCSPSGLWIMLTCLQSVLYSYSGLWTMLPCLQSVLCSHSGLWTTLTCLQLVLCSYSGLWTMLTCLQSILYSYTSPLHPQSMLQKNSTSASA